MRILRVLAITALGIALAPLPVPATEPPPGLAALQALAPEPGPDVPFAAEKRASAARLAGMGRRTMKMTTNGARRAAARLRLLVATLTIAAVIAAEPGGAGAGSGPDLQPQGLRTGVLVSALRANGAEIVPLGARGGMNGYFVTPAKGGGYSLYVTEDGHAVAGLLYGTDGTEITGAQLAAARAGAAWAQQADAEPPETLVPVTAAPAMTAHATSDAGGPASSSPSRTGLFERSAAAFGFTIGARGPVAVLLGDPTCSFSRSATARLGRAALDGWLQLRVVPVAVLGADAARRAVAIASQPEPARAWFEGGGIDDLRAADRAGAQRIARNNAIFDEWGATAVPLIAWQTRDGAVGHRIGDIDDVDAWLQETLVPATLRVGDTRAGDGHE